MAVELPSSSRVPAFLVLADGSIFKGYSIGAEGYRGGEVVFNTAMTGYQEILTDPSYCRQIVTLTYPHIGNVGVNQEDEESAELFAAGLIVREIPRQLSSWRAQGGLPEYLKARGMIAMAGVDTRRLTRLLREKGAQNGCIWAGEENIPAALEVARTFPGLNGMDLAKVVSCTRPYPWTEGVWHLSGITTRPEARFRVIAYDFGIKRNILRMLVERGCAVQVVPATTPAQDVLSLRPDGVFLSNGPGDPEACTYAIQAVRELLAARVPVFGICLGHQLLALASGGRTLKMKFGHHGANHPVLDQQTGRVLITSQNHGFAVDTQDLPAHLTVTHVSLFDGSVQGLARTDVPAFSFQGHPEACPGPHDAAPLFDRFIALMQESGI
ncbi:glutamine-hydrolyzing carbamoyl-phosphate synthase small subunit [Ferrovum myxofaciens]|jgi:carbamoyl-phosphate synthase small subunit|uniref:Carbamoyl phosphate synthase small chain n=2 Tax=root TaxID=1 RepID=A0A9E6MUZ9_9PROT|nr:glutamine-hydrolyzing carbamoyl-phosphate synthase small subunit [Ferrovum myxofaciens]MBW8028988.1 glutamine-hydrolyzing carbamoyl-phosphate synthase small subunit [Ferrovum sp.]QKE38916.1 MAG: glutamine-hydrolyzing carbamoyl-phosphate synthase small subunit [Ferrovum myxofaciens]QWY74125.1 MAG: glutamine-hydrolyzing carbamoyl-phosphate synthase small subunit [Ferrovum myxofaciens]QWY76877.1 MAG: glutamine-hydrolyzing carbamoyl-phosphate synthase small subunit [Ferrovum myxofaciens]